MVSELLNRRSLGSLNSLAEDSLSTFNDAFTIYGHPKVKNTLKAFEQLQMVQIPEYRTALKLRAIQRKMQLHRIDVRDIITVFSECGLPAPHEEVTESDMEPIITDVCLMAERNVDTTIVSCEDLILTWILQLFDSNYVGAVPVKQFTTALVLMGAGRLIDKLKYLFETFKDTDGMLTQERFAELLTVVLLIPCSVFEEEIYGHSNLVAGAAFECFNQVDFERDKISMEQFLQWTVTSPFSLNWLHTLHRLMCGEYSVSMTTCSSCNTAPIIGLRYVSLHNYDTELCQSCVWTGNCSQESELREFGVLSLCHNVTAVSGCKSLVTSYLSTVQSSLDDRLEDITSYCKRINPESSSHFISLSETISGQEMGDVENLVKDYDERAVRLQRDFNSISKEHSQLLVEERRSGPLQAWKLRDDISSRLAVWMSRRNDLYTKQEALLKECNIPLPSHSYTTTALSSAKSTGSLAGKDTTNGILNGLDGPSPRITVEESVMVLSKLSLIINNVLLQKSLCSTPPSSQPSTPTTPNNHAPQPQSPLENNLAAAHLSNGTCSKTTSVATPVVTVASPEQPSVAMTTSDNIATTTITPVVMTTAENDAMKEFEDTMNVIMVQEKLIPASKGLVRKSPIMSVRVSSPSASNDQDDNRTPTPKSQHDPIDKLDSVRRISTPTLKEGVIAKEDEKSRRASETAIKTTRENIMVQTKPRAYSSPKTSYLPLPKSQIPVASPASNTEKRQSNLATRSSNMATTKPSSLMKPGTMATQSVNHETRIPFPSHIAIRRSSEPSTSNAPRAGDNLDKGVGLGKSESLGEEDDWVSEGSWETEEENTTNTERSLPPDNLTLDGDITTPDEVSEPECDPADVAPPIPPPRNLLSPQGVSRRATSLKTKENDPRMEELRKVTRAASSVHAKHKPTGIPTRHTPTAGVTSPTVLSRLSDNSPVNTPSPRQISKLCGAPKTNTPESLRAGFSTPETVGTPEIPPRGTPDLARGTPEARGTPPGSSKLRAPAAGKPKVRLAHKTRTPLKGPIVDEGDTDSDTSSSSSSSSDDKGKFTRARSARFPRNKPAVPNRNAASFRTKKSKGPEKPLEFFNNFAE